MAPKVGHEYEFLGAGYNRHLNRLIVQDEINIYKDNNTKAMTMGLKNNNSKATCNNARPFVGAKTKVVGFIRKKLSSKYLILCITDYTYVAIHALIL